jgi:arylsulfatase A-like enzyme
MMTGLYPQAHGAFRNGVRLGADKRTLAEILHDNGFRTGAVVSGWTLRDVQCGLGQGFDAYDDSGMDQRYNVVNLMRRADAVTTSALKWIDSAPAATEPWFLFVHYYDPHEPYDAPVKVALPPNPAASHAPRTERFPDKLADYDQEVHFADAELGRLIDGLKARGLMADTLVVFTADHGQSFGEHDYGGINGAHGRKVYQSQIAVPLVLWMPGKVRVGTCDLPVAHVDLLPTIAEILALPRDAVPAGPGASLARVAEDAAAPPPWGRAERTRYGLAFSGAVGNRWNIFRWAQNKNVEHAEPLCAYVLGGDGRKVIVDFANKKRIEIYDLKTDPAETTNLAGQAPVAQCEAKGEQVFAWYDRTRQCALTTQAPSAEDLEKLKALGYVE